MGISQSSSSSAFIIDSEGCLIVRPGGQRYFARSHPHGHAGIGARTSDSDYRTALAPPSSKAREAFLTSATTFIMPIVEADGHQIADGQPGPMTQKITAVIHIRIWRAPHRFNRCRPFVVTLPASLVLSDLTALLKLNYRQTVRRLKVSKPNQPAPRSSTSSKFFQPQSIGPCLILSLAHLKKIMQVSNDCEVVRGAG